MKNSNTKRAEVAQIRLVLHPKKGKSYDTGKAKWNHQTTMNRQAMMDGLSTQWQKERSESQMTLGTLIDTLAAMPPETELEGFGEAHSYRGYYSDLAFEKMEEKTTAGKALEMARACMGEVFTGYKGGDFQMGRNTPVWIANYGLCGMKIMAFQNDGTIELAERSNAEVWDGDAKTPPRQ